MLRLTEANDIMSAINLVFQDAILSQVVLQEQESKSNEKKQNPYENVLEEESEKKTKEIQHICEKNHKKFIEAIDELVGMKNTMGTLRERMSYLNRNIQHEGMKLWREMEEIVELKQVQQKIILLSKEMEKLVKIFYDIETIQCLIREHRYVNALKTLQTLSMNYLLPLQQRYSIVQDISSVLVPHLTNLIQVNVLTHFKHWLYQTNNQSVVLGTFALQQCRRFFMAIEPNPMVNFYFEEEMLCGFLNSTLQQSHTHTQIYCTKEYPEISVTNYERSRVDSPLMRQTKSAIEPVTIVETKKKEEEEDIGSAQSPLILPTNSSRQNVDNHRANNGTGLTGVTGSPLLTSEPVTTLSLLQKIEETNRVSVYECIRAYTLLNAIGELKKEYKELRVRFRDQLLNKSNLSLNKPSHLATCFLSFVLIFCRNCFQKHCMHDKATLKHWIVDL
ncbi:hypothetical protein RFI_08649 [Reticulomyxa filosa]|uniref:Exocyst complex component EXOC6/Sec15 N-terminal domain-containing protein n=1 Tax=Reticulomyxa filosa TaxID=46433 RepID=X6NR56_RETFI|nr:hypothetical protein RFI_08649 [Reticulomyxa filosa]|eukprot:ETO28486.1 hypothetical protein RFI_08649 [Reticulomyxa filosa]